MARLLDLHAFHGGHNQALRATRDAGGADALRDDPTSLGQIERSLQTVSDPVLLSRIVGGARNLRMHELTPALQRLAERSDAAPMVRMQAVQTLLVLQPQDGFADGWIARAADRQFEHWNTTEQAIFLSLLPALPIESAMKHAREIESWAQNRFAQLEAGGATSTPELGATGHILSTARRLIQETRRAEGIEQTAPDKLPAALVDEFVENHPDATRAARAVQSILRNELTEPVVAEVQGRLPNAVSTAETGVLLRLLDELGVPLTDEQIDRLEQVFPLPPL